MIELLSQYVESRIIPNISEDELGRISDTLRKTSIISEQQFGGLLKKLLPDEMSLGLDTALGFKDLLTMLKINGFFYGSISRDDNVMPDLSKIIEMGLNPLDPFYGNDLDVVIFSKDDARRLVQFFNETGLGNHLRLHIFYYNRNDISEQIPLYIDKRLEIIPGTLKLVLGPEAKRLRKKAHKMGLTLSDFQLINDRKVRDKIKSHYRGNVLGNVYSGPGGNIGLSEHYKNKGFLELEDLRSSTLGCLIIQFISAVKKNKCHELVSKLKNKLDQIDVSGSIVANVRTMYDPESYNGLTVHLLARPRYLYDGLMKLFRTTYTKVFGTKKCCQHINGIGFLEELTDNLIEKGLDLNELRSILGLASLIKVYSRDPENEFLIRQAGELLIEDYLRVCKKVDQAYFSEVPKIDF